jgi:hypothetical protein
MAVFPAGEGLDADGSSMFETYKTGVACVRCSIDVKWKWLENASGAAELRNRIARLPLPNCGSPAIVRESHPGAVTQEAS